MNGALNSDQEDSVWAAFVRENKFNKRYPPYNKKKMASFELCRYICLLRYQQWMKDSLMQYIT